MYTRYFSGQLTLKKFYVALNGDLFDKVFYIDISCRACFILLLLFLLLLLKLKICVRTVTLTITVVVLME